MDLLVSQYLSIRSPAAGRIFDKEVLREMEDEERRSDAEEVERAILGGSCLYFEPEKCKWLARRYPY
jgi:hypothetical protein